MDRPNVSLAGLPQHTFVALPPLARLRFQVPLAFFLGAVMPALLIGDGTVWRPFPLSAASNAFYISMLCSWLGLLFFRRLGSFPGITSFGQVGAAVAGPYAFALFAIFIARLDYSRPLLLTSACAATALYFGLWFYVRKHCAPAIYVVPGANFDIDRGRVFAAELAVPPQMFERNPIIVANLHLDLSPEWENYILKAALSGVPVFHQKHLKESILGKVGVEHLSENSFGSLNPNQLYMRAKRGFDIFVCVLALPVLAPIFVIVAAAIRLESRGPIFFLQSRMGFGGRSFKMIKFRSMLPRAEAQSSRDDARTLHGDARITKVGRVIRRLRIDELPQVINILQGEMSWIGPRPEADQLSEWYSTEIPFYGYRHLVRPGITGWAQVHQGHVHDVEEVKEKLKYDFYYIKYFSWWLDALIAVRTIRTVLVGNGSR